MPQRTPGFASRQSVAYLTTLRQKNNVLADTVSWLPFRFGGFSDDTVFVQLKRPVMCFTTESGWTASSQSKQTCVKRIFCLRDC